MQITSFRFLRAAFSAFSALLIMSTAVLAGPPLICHSFDIGTARSLPWISHDWNLAGSENFDTNKLAGETLAILDASDVPLVHMETLRRATLYARKDPVAAKQLLLKLVARVQSNELAARPNAFAFFDSAYLVEAYKQWLGEEGRNPTGALDSSAWLRKAIQLRGDDPQMELAAALITLNGPQAEHREHADRAISGAKHDQLLARNLQSHFWGSQGQTVAEIILSSDPKTVAKN
jgi:hypothetical protein